jgi:hypothetical protein
VPRCIEEAQQARVERTHAKKKMDKIDFLDVSCAATKMPAKTAISLICC